MLASGDDDGAVKLWDLVKGRAHATLKGHSTRVTTVRFSSDQKLLASASRDAVRLWNGATGKQRAALYATSVHNALVSVSFSPAGKTLATGNDAGEMKLWSVTGKHLATLTEFDGCVSLAFSADGKTFASGARTGTLKSRYVAKR